LSEVLGLVAFDEDELYGALDQLAARQHRIEQALHEAGLRYISALTDPQIRRLLREGTLQLSLFSEAVCEVDADGVRYVLRKNESEAALGHQQACYALGAQSSGAQRGDDRAVDAAGEADDGAAASKRPEDLGADGLIDDGKALEMN
jgi:hypothetical protein